MQRTVRLLALLLGGLAAYLLLGPVPIRAVAWTPPPYDDHAAPHARNRRLGELHRVALTPETGPEHIEFGPDGKLYTGVLSGNVLRANPDGTQREVYANTGGRPLGLAFEASGRLIVADALRGLLGVHPGGAVVVLADSVALEPIRYVDAVAVAADGHIVFTDASTRFSPQDHGTFDAALLDVIEHSCSGRVLEYDPTLPATRIVAQGLCFPNGIALSADQRSLLVAETASYRVVKLPRDVELLDVRAALAAGDPAVTVVLDNMPGFPDNITRGPQGRYWVGLTKPRSATIDMLASRPRLREVLLRLPRFLWPVPPAYGHVIAFDERGHVLADLQDPEGALPETSGATEHAGALYVQSLHADAYGVLPFSGASAALRSR